MRKRNRLDSGLAGTRGSDESRRDPLENLREIGKKKVLTNLGTMTVAKVGGKLPLKIDDESAIPQEYFNQRTVYELDKEKLRTAIEGGEVVYGAHLEERGSYLKIS